MFSLSKESIFLDIDDRFSCLLAQLPVEDIYIYTLNHIGPLGATILTLSPGFTVDSSGHLIEATVSKREPMLNVREGRSMKRNNETDLISFWIYGRGTSSSGNVISKISHVFSKSCTRKLISIEFTVHTMVCFFEFNDKQHSVEVDVPETCVSSTGITSSHGDFIGM